MKIARQSVYVALRPTCFEHADLLSIILVRCNGENALFLVAKLNYICIVGHRITFFLTMHHFRCIAVDWNAIFHLAYVKDATLGK